MTINELQDEVIEEFVELEDWMDRYQLLIDLGEDQEALPEEHKTTDNLIDGCQSRVWLVCENQNGLLHFAAESDALIVKGIVSLLLRVVNNHTAQEILDADLYFIREIGLTEHLSPTRSNGLLAMVKQGITSGNSHGRKRFKSASVSVGKNASTWRRNKVFFRRNKE